jgi:tetratricopeptide (TPR) repeat protein
VQKVDRDWLWIGRAWVKKSNVLPLESAALYYDEILRRDPECSWAHHCRGILCVISDRDWDGAHREFTAAVQIDPENASAYYGRGTLWLAKSEYENARNDFTAVIDLDPNNVDAFTQRGRTLLAEAERNMRFQHANGGELLFIADGAFHSLPATNPPWNADVIDTLERAEKDFTNALAIDPKNTTAFLRRAQARDQLGRINNAIDDATAAIGIDPKMSTAYRARGLYWLERKSFRNAVADFQSCLQFDTNNLVSHASLAFIFAACPRKSVRDGAQAVYHANRACELSNWNNPKYLTYLALAHAESGNFEQAVKWQETALAVASDAEQPELEKALDDYKSRKTQDRVPTR